MKFIKTVKTDSGDELKLERETDSAVELALEDARTDHLHNFRDEAMKALLPHWEDTEE